VSAAVSRPFVQPDTACCRRPRVDVLRMLAGKRAGRGRKRGGVGGGGDKSQSASARAPQPPAGVSSQRSAQQQPQQQPQQPPPPQQSPSQQPLPSFSLQPTADVQDEYVGPMAPPPDLEEEGPGSGDPDTLLPVASEARFRLPDAPASVVGGVARRRRRRRAVDYDLDDSEDVDNQDEDADGPISETDRGGGSRGSDSPLASRSNRKPEVGPDQTAVDAVRQLTDEFRKGSVDATSELMREIEKDPDFMFQSGNATNEYDMAAALIGTGRPNKQGIYVLPYLQSGHILLLLVVLLCAFVYYPGFPLTELDDEIREWLKRGLGLTYLVNAVLAGFAYRAAKLRSQPPLFWAAKTALLGGLSFQELRTNVLLDSEKSTIASQRGGRKRSRKARDTKQ
jgi:hypothetical protein